MEKNTSSSTYKVIGACDCAYTKDGKIQVCVAVAFGLEKFKLIEYAISNVKNPYKYIPGKFYLREGDTSIETIKKLKSKFDLLLINGHGKGNIEGKGLACYIGERLKVPTVGIAKQLLFGSFKEPENKKGSSSPVFFKNEIIAYALRTRENVKPLFVSEGYDVNLKKILIFISSLCIWRFPEPLRLAHILAKENLKNFLNK